MYKINLVKMQPDAAYNMLHKVCGMYVEHYLHVALTSSPGIVQDFAEDCCYNAWFSLCDGVAFTKVSFLLSDWFGQFFSSDTSRQSVKLPYVCSHAFTNARIHDNLHFAVFRLQASVASLNTEVTHRELDTDFRSWEDALHDLRERFGDEYVDAKLASVHRSTFTGPERDKLFNLFRSLV